MRDATDGQPRRWWRPLHLLGEALRFLTIVPIPGLPHSSPPALAGAASMFPLVGALIGALLAGLGLTAGALWPRPATSVILVVGWAAVSAGLHLDGLSDTFDAVLSWRPRERKLEIMRDSRIGTMGALALMGLLALKVVWIEALGDAWLRAVWLAPVLGRWAMVYGLFWFPPARGDGLGQQVQSRTRRVDCILATALALALAVLLGGLSGIVALVAVGAATNLLARWWVRELGGLTGDTYGALCELTEALTLAVLAAMAGKGV